MDRKLDKVPVPEEIKDRFLLWLIGTGADNKLTGLLEALLADDRYFLAFNPEQEGLFKEPDLPDVELVAWYKAMVVLFLLEYFTREELEAAGVPLGEGERPATEIKSGTGGRIERPEPAIALSMDVLTEVETLPGNNEEVSRRVEFLKLSRRTKGKTETEIREIIAQDKSENEALFRSPLKVTFRMGMAAVSSDHLLNNTAGVEITVITTGFPQWLIDEGYASDKVTETGPRLNLAEITEKHPEFIKSVEMRQINLDKNEHEVQTGRGRRRKVKLPKRLYYLVRQIVMDGVLPAPLMENLLEGRPESGLLRTRGNILDIIAA